MRANLSNTPKSVDETRNREAELLNDIQKAQLTGAWEWDPSTDHYFWTDSMFFLHGLLPSSDNLISIEAANHMIYPLDLAWVQQKWDELKKKGSADYFFRVLLPDGTIKQLHARSRSVPIDASESIFRGTFQEENGELPTFFEDEITRLKIQLSILERGEEISQVGSWQINLSTFDTFYSDNIFRLHGVPPGSLNAHLDTFSRFIHNEDRDVVINAFERSYHERIPVHLEYRIVTPDGEVRFIKQLSSIIKNEKGEHLLTGTTHDITEKKLLELALQESYDELQVQHKLFEQAEQIGGTGNWQINLQTRKAYYSDNVYVLHGIRPQSLPATPETFLSYVHPDDRPTIIEHASKIYEGHILPQIEYRIVRQDGKVRTLRQTSKKITHPSGDELVYAIIQDITEQHTTRSQLKELNERLLLKTESFTQAEKIVSIGSWFWNLSTGTITVSEYINSIYGLKPGLVIRDIAFFSGFIHPEDRAVFDNVINRMKQEEPHADGDYRIIRADGDIRHLRNRNKRITSPEGHTIAIGTVQDITHEVLLSQELAERIDFTEMLSDTILDTIIVTDTSNNIVACNRQCEKVHGFKKQDVLRRNIFDVFPALKNAEMVENFRRALQGKTIQLPALRTTLAKGYHDLLMRPLKNNQGQIIGVLALLHDVTQEHHLRQELKQRLTFIEKLVESSIDRIMVLDQHLNYILWNKSCENYYGVKKEDIVGKNVLELFPMFKVDPVYQDCKKALSGENIHIPPKKTNENEYNESFLVPLKNEKGQVTSILWVIHDLTEIMLAKEKLATSETHLKAAQEIAHLGSWEYDHASGTLNWSDEVYRIYGYEPGSFEPNVEFYKNTSHPDNRADVDKLFAAPGEVYSFINKIYTLDGRIRYVQTMGRPVPDESGSTTKLIGTVQDITEQKILQDELHEKTAAIRSQYENARQAAMMRNVGTWQWNLQTGGLFWGESLFGFFGYKPFSLEPNLEKFISMVHPGDRQMLTGVLEGIKKGEIGTLPAFDYRIIDAEGRIKYVRSTSRVVSNQKGKYLTGTVQDITAEVLQKQQLSWYHQLLQTIIESCTDAISVYDHQMHCTSWNRGSEVLFGKLKAQTLGRNLFDIFPEIGNKTNILKIEQLIKGGEEVHLGEATLEITSANSTVICKPLIHGDEKNTGLLLITPVK